MLFKRKVLLIGCATLLGCDRPKEASPNAISDAAVEASTLDQLQPTQDVRKVVGASRAEVDALWGIPKCPPKNACVYGDMREVYFVGGVAANVTLPPVGDLRLYGLDLGVPELDRPEAGIKRWKTQINGRTAEVSQFEDYVYVKTAEP